MPSIKAKPVGAMPKKVTDKSIEINPGPKDSQFNKKGQSPLNRSGKLASSSGPSNMKDVQFNKGQSKMGTTGSLGKSTASANMGDQQFNKGQSKMSRAGKTSSKSNSSSGMADEQFNDGDSYNANNDDGSVNKGKKTKGGTGMQIAGRLGKAQKIMQAVAKASQASGSISKSKGHSDDITKVSQPHGSKPQSDSYKNSTKETPQPRAKSMNRGFGSK